jgi:NAD(P)-dependent dehydrogenase (short-subunit alcohol dehydrogenase family)
MRMIALITGVGAKGQVGEAVAEAFLRRGDTVIIVSRSPDEAAERTRELSALGSIHGYPCDLAKPNEVARLADQVRTEHGDKVDALVNLAGGFGSSGPLAESDPSALTRLFDINLKTAYLATRAFLPMVKAAQGSIVYFASEAVLEGSQTSGVAGYVAAKSAVVGLMRSVADEGRESGTRANALAPAAIRTASNQASMPSKTHYVEREEVAAMVLYLCSSAAAGVTSQVIRLR